MRVSGERHALKLSNAFPYHRVLDTTLSGTEFRTGLVNTFIAETGKGSKGSLQMLRTKPSCCIVEKVLPKNKLALALHRTRTTVDYFCMLKNPCVPVLPILTGLKVEVDTYD